jgi:hypothetical protein
MESVTLATLKTQVREAANMENSQFVSDAELTRYIDLSYAELYDLLVKTFENYYTNSTPIPVTVASGANTIDLPGDFYKLVGIDVAFGSSWYPIRTFEMAERGRWVNANKLAYVGLINIAYKIIGGKIVLYPESSSSGNYRYWYVPRRTPLTSDASVVDSVQGWHQYIVIDSAIKCLQKEESDISALMSEKQAMLERINQMAPNRDAGTPRKISDTTTSYMGFGYGGGFYGK